MVGWEHINLTGDYTLAQQQAPQDRYRPLRKLAVAMLLLSRRAPVHEQREDSTGSVRLVVPAPTPGKILKESVGHIAIYAASDAFGDGFAAVRARHGFANVADPGDRAPGFSRQREQHVFGQLRPELLIFVRRLYVRTISKPFVINGKLAFSAPRSRA